MRVGQWVKILLHGILWGSLCFAGYTMSARITTSPFLTILSNHEPELGLPVFAQFVVTQTLAWDTNPVVSRLRIPMYLPERAEPIRILLYQDDRLIASWKYPLLGRSDHGVVDADLSFVTPITLQGKFSLVFDGRNIAYEDKEFAPRIFTETFDAAYPNGNYRIANNEKQGDVGLEIIQQKTGLDLFLEKWKDPVGTTSLMLLIAAGLILLSRLPGVIVGFFGQTRKSSKKKRKRVSQPTQEA